MMSKIFTKAEVEAATATFDLSEYPDEDRLNIARALIVTSAMIQGKSMDEAASLIGLTRGGISKENWQRWLSIAKKMIAKDIVLQINASNISILEKYQQLIVRMMDEALMAVDVAKMLQVVQWVKREILDPASNAVQDIGGNELQAVKEAGKRNFNPMVVLERLTITGEPSVKLQERISTLILDQEASVVNGTSYSMEHLQSSDESGLLYGLDPQSDYNDDSLVQSET